MRTSITWAGVSDSENEVNPRRSVNITVPSRWTPPRRSSVGALQHLVDDVLGNEPREQVDGPDPLERFGDELDGQCPVAPSTSAPSGYTNDTTGRR